MTSNLPERRLAYFTMEAGIRSGMRTYSGGLGVLAGDTLKVAADMGLPLVGVTLLHRKGYFEQRLDETGVQRDGPDQWNTEEHLREVEARVEVPLPDRTLHVRAWEYRLEGVRGDVVPVYFLDTDLPENRDEDRRLTDHLYGGDLRYRMLQETILGYGGTALLRALGHRRIHTFHMNEGHCSFVALALLQERTRDALSGPQPADDQWVRDRCVFTTHTPVPAGHDRFDASLVEEVLGSERLALLRGRGLEDGVLNMTEVGFHFSRFVNGVALRHAHLSREMFPGRQIHPITNGVHAGTWTSPPLAALFDRHISDWRFDPLNLRHACMLPLDELREARRGAKALLLEAVRERKGMELSPDVLTIGFARRATPYKRADLLFDDVERLRAIARANGGLQVVYAGKAHPRDTGGQDLIRHIHEAARELGDEVRVVYLENYDMELGGLITAGVDVWLNNPEKPKEASGTSGMKAALNGVLNLSVMDGWWIEGHVEGVTGWAIGRDWNQQAERAEEAADLYDKLEHHVLPLYAADDDRFDMMRRYAISLNGGQFSARRMMAQYVALAYRSGEGVGATWPRGEREKVGVPAD